MGVLPQSFFLRDSRVVARGLLGKFLVRKIGRRNIAGMITDVEVYDGRDDAASHASRGRTARNAPMFERGGLWYVYFVYGMHWMLNSVTREKGYPAAILIRGVRIDGVPYSQTNGPAKLTKYMRVGASLNGRAASPRSGLWIEDRGFTPKRIMKSPRIGVEYAGKWKYALRRFYMEA